MWGKNSERSDTLTFQAMRLENGSNDGFRRRYYGLKIRKVNSIGNLANDLFRGIGLL